MKKHCSEHKVLLTDEIMCVCVCRGIHQFHIYISMYKSASPQNTKDICELLKPSPDLTSVTQPENCTELTSCVEQLEGNTSDT